MNEVAAAATGTKKNSRRTIMNVKHVVFSKLLETFLCIAFIVVFFILPGNGVTLLTLGVFS